MELEDDGVFKSTKGVGNVDKLTDLSRKLFFFLVYLTDRFRLAENVHGHGFGHGLLGCRGVCRLLQNSTLPLLRT